LTRSLTSEEAYRTWAARGETRKFKEDNFKGIVDDIIDTIKLGLGPGEWEHVRTQEIQTVERTLDKSKDWWVQA
jgi:hypothetical protein